MDKCNIDECKDKDCTFENCPVYYYKDCYDYAREGCLKNLPVEVIAI
jgi:hypothetical protein